jgi:hypothetical protein
MRLRQRDRVRSFLSRSVVAVTIQGLLQKQNPGGITMKNTATLGVALFMLAAQAHAQVAGETITNPDAGSVVAAGTGPQWRGILGAPLYTNGALQTAATGGGPAGTSPVSVLNSPPDTTLGATCNTATFRLADDFTVPAGPNWTVTGVTVFGYQTQAGAGGSTVSTMTAGVLRIWNGPPNVGTSTVVFGDVTTNRLTTTSFSGVWRVTTTTLTNLQRPIMAVEMGGLSVNLAPGTYWLEYGISGSTASGPFCPPNATVATTNNALQFNVGTAAWVPATDGGSTRPLDMPFVIEGTAAAPAITPTVPAGAVNLGTVVPGSAITRSFAFSNAASATGPGTVSCTLAGAPPGFVVTPSGVQTIAPGATATFSVTGPAPTVPGAFSAGTLTCAVQGIAAPVVYTISGTVATPTSVPTLSAFGLLLAALSLLIGGMWMARRHA